VRELLWIAERELRQRPPGRRGKAHAELHGVDGRLARAIDLGPAVEAEIDGEPAAGQLVVVLYSDPNATPDDVLLVDLDSGSVRKLARCRRSRPSLLERHDSQAWKPRYETV
jgi:hypothetical protein